MFPCRRLCVLFVLSILVAVVSGCASLPITGRLPEGISVRKICAIDKGTPFAWNRAGDGIAFADGSLLIYDLKSKAAAPLVADDGLAALDWSPDGRHIAAAFRRGEDSLLRIFDIHGKIVSESKIEGEATRLVWRSGGEVLVSAVVIKMFSFGANYSGILYSWNGKTAPAAKVLTDTTLKMSTARMPKDTLYGAFTFALSPVGDELVYTKFVDPPQYPSHLKLFLYNLETGAEREAASNVPLDSGGAVLTADGERIVYGDGADKTLQLDPWTGAVKSRLHSPGRSIAVSPANLYLLLDGTLFRGEEALVSFPAATKGAFSPRGDHLLLEYENRLYLVSGLNEPPAAVLPPDLKERLLKLRKWRSEGLISVSEYEAAKERLK